MKLGFIGLAAATLLAAASPTFRWLLPAGIAPPHVPLDNPMSDAKVALGRRLFYDADLSVDGTMACSTCHEQRHGFADPNRTHAGVHGEAGRRNVPGLANVAWRAPLTWANPRLATLEAQALVPLIGNAPTEMGMAGMDAELARRLRRDPCYRRMFKAAFPEAHGRIDRRNVVRALAAFQRTLVSFNAPVDRGQAPAAGAKIFAAKCASCHSGHDFTDDRFHVLGSHGPADSGLQETTGKIEDAGSFRTPSLRNMTVTGPWLHDGSADTINEALLAHPGYRREDTLALEGYLASLTDPGFLADPRFSYPDMACTGPR